MSTQTGLNEKQITLLKMALEYLGDQNGQAGTYAKRIKSQVELIQAGNDSITTNDWVKMAKVLSYEAIQRDIGAERIAETIYPLLDGSGQYLRGLSYIPASFATDKLLKFAGVSVSPEIKRLLIDVVSELQKMVVQKS
jgi:hypothetical protein